MLGFAAATASALELREHGAFTPALRVELPAVPHGSRLAMDLEASGARGRSTQALAGGDTAQLDRYVLSGPATLANGVEVNMIDTVLRWPVRDPPRTAALELLGGLSLARVNVIAATADRSAGEDRLAGGLLLGIAARWRIVPSTAVEARYRFFTSRGELEAENDIHRVDLTLVHALGRRVAARGGYQYWDVLSQRVGSSEMRARLAGPTLGLDLRF